MVSRMRVVLTPEAAVSTKEFTARTSIPLCDLRDLCAMLSRMRPVLAPEAAVSTKELSARTSIPLCDLRDLCAMLSPSRGSLTEAPYHFWPSL
jgi:hypothetical protein